jgi:hypothetical protein
MHYRFLVTFDSKHATTSYDARRFVLDTLQDEGFCNRGRWDGGMADWFLIGGRWSGELSRHSWGEKLYTEIAEIEQEHDIQLWGAHYNDSLMQVLQQHLTRRVQMRWDNAAPEAYKGIPIQRDTDKDFGYEDDAMLLTQELYDALLKEYEGKVESEHHADLDYEEVTPAMVGKKWLVVVDYHN